MTQPDLATLFDNVLHCLLGELGQLGLRHAFDFEALVTEDRIALGLLPGSVETRQQGVARR
jgi:hypothetical protein